MISSEINEALSILLGARREKEQNTWKRGRKRKAKERQAQYCFAGDEKRSDI